MFSKLSDTFRGLLSARAQSGRPRRRLRRLAAEPLEARRLLTFAVDFTNGLGDGTVHFEVVDPYGAFGSGVFTGSAFQDPDGNQINRDGIVFYDPVGGFPDQPTMFESGIAIGFHITDPDQPEPERLFLTSGLIHDSGNLVDPDIVIRQIGDVQILESEFDYQQLFFDVDQYLAFEYSTDDPTQIVGSLFSQVYTMTNTGDETTRFDVMRFVDGDLEWASSSSGGELDDDGGGYTDFRDTVNGFNHPVVFFTNEPTAEQIALQIADPTAISVMAYGGNQTVVDQWEVNEVNWPDAPDSWNWVFPSPRTTRALTESVLNDGGDSGHVIDPDRGYDVGVVIKNLYELAAGETATFYTSTLFGAIFPPSGSFLPPKGTIEGTIWNDANGDGFRALGDDGISGLTVFLDVNGDGQLSTGERRATTDGDGIYLMADVDPGTYQVMVDMPADFVQTDPLGTGVAAVVEVGQDTLDADIGIHFSGATVSGTKWADLNANTTRDPGEPGLAGWTIYADVDGDRRLDPGEPRAVTGTGGNYTLFLSPGTYTIAEVQQGNWTQTFPGGDGTHLVTLVADQVLTGIDFGNDPDPANVSGTVWDDENADGVRDGFEIGVGGMTVFLDENGNDNFDLGERQTTTGIDGGYSFADVEPGTVNVAIDLPPLFELTAPTGGRYSVQLSAGQTTGGLDFGIRLLDGEMSGVVFFDYSGDGIQDADEPGAEGFAVYMDLDDNGQIGLGEPVALTDQDGTYIMPEARPGTRVVRVLLQPGTAATLPVGGMSSVTIPPGGSVPGVNFGLIEQADFGDAPAPYPTLEEQNGAKHGFLDGFYLGLGVAPEGNGQPTIGADGDDGIFGDEDGEDDEDGVALTSLLVPGHRATVDVTTSKDNGILQGWVDFNRDGDWDDPGEQVFTDLWLPGGVNHLAFDVPADATIDNTYARFRFGFERGISYTGEALAGEVEDYVLPIDAPPGGGGGGGGEPEPNPWHNDDNRLDVNSDTEVSPSDALTIINQLNANGAMPLAPFPTTITEWLFDVSGDLYLSALDALLVINHLNRLAAAGAAAEGAPDAARIAASPSLTVSAGALAVGAEPLAPARVDTALGQSARLGSNLTPVSDAAVKSIGEMLARRNAAGRAELPPSAAPMSEELLETLSWELAR